MYIYNEMAGVKDGDRSTLNVPVKLYCCGLSIGYRAPSRFIITTRQNTEFTTLNEV